MQLFLILQHCFSARVVRSCLYLRWKYLTIVQDFVQPVDQFYLLCRLRAMCFAIIASKSSFQKVKLR